VHLRRAGEEPGHQSFQQHVLVRRDTHPKPDDFRPEVHDSDGLQIKLADGRYLWRPLDNTPGQLRLSIFETPKLKGFGLGERDRDFKNF